jgi:hypothetical protein
MAQTPELSLQSSPDTEGPTLIIGLASPIEVQNHLLLNLILILTNDPRQKFSPEPLIRHLIISNSRP